MRIREITVQNIKGVEHLTLKLGSVTVISGENGIGKSSCLDAVRSVFDGGHSPNLIRRGEKRGEVTILLDDGTSINKTITPKTSTLTITGPDGAEIRPPMAFVEKLASGFAFDPLSFVSAKPKDRAAFLLDAMPLTFSAAEIAKAWEEYSGAAVDLAGLDTLYKQLYESRRAANVAERDADGTVKTLLAALPEDDETDWAKAVEAIDAERVEVERQISAALAAAETTAIKAEQAIVNEINEKIAALHEEKNQRVADVKKNQTASICQIEEIAKPERDRLAGEIATARERANAQAKAAGTRQSIEITKKKAKEHMAKSLRLDRAIKALESLKKQKLDSLPIEGVEVRDGDVYVGGVPFDDLNTASQYTCAFQVAALKSGDLGFMLADRAECLESETTYKDFIDAAQGSGFQVLMARVATGKRKVEVFA